MGNSKSKEPAFDPNAQSPYNVGFQELTDANEASRAGRVAGQTLHAAAGGPCEP